MYIVAANSLFAGLCESGYYCVFDRRRLPSPSGFWDRTQRSPREVIFLVTCFLLVVCFVTLKIDVVCSSEASVYFCRNTGVTTQKIVLFIATAVRTSDPAEIHHFIRKPFFVWSILTLWSARQRDREKSEDKELR